MSYVRNVIRSAPQTLSPADQRAILDVTGKHAAGFRDHVLFSLALGTALRESELVALNVGDVARASLKPAELKRGIEPIRSKIQLRTFKRSRHDPPARPGAPPPREQRVFLPRNVRLKLAKYLTWKKRQAEDLRPPAPLFVSRHGLRLSTRQVRRVFTLWQRRAGLEEIYTFHKLRHTALTNLYAATKDLLLVQKQARHRNASTTEIYAHVSDEDLRRAVEGMFS